MDHIQVDSSVIKSIAHDPDRKEMEVMFHSGKVYRYSGVTQSEFDTFLEAPSLGAHFNQTFKGREM